jgi:hypothetical protein
MKILLFEPSINEVYVVDLNQYKTTPNCVFIFCKSNFIVKTISNPTPFGDLTKTINPWTYWSNEEKLESIRLQRDYLLQETDWVTIRAVDTEIPESQAWKNYRQALRDFPANVNVNLPIEQIVWPQKPA